MKRTAICLGVLIIFLMFLGSFSVHAQSSNPQQTLNQYISDLQKNPNDYALREKIIKHVQAMKSKPAVPDEASKYMDRGLAAIEGGKGEEDFRAASAEFLKAVNLAPWLGDAYRNLAIAQDKSGQYDAALRNLRLYLQTSPSPADEAWAKSLINKVEYRKEKAAKESSPVAIADKKRQEEEAFIRKLDGVRYKYYFSSEREAGDWTIDVRGNRVIQGYMLVRNVYGQPNGVWKQWQETTLNGREFNIRASCMVAGDMIARVFKGKINEDGYTVMLEDCNGTNTYRRER